MSAGHSAGIDALSHLVRNGGADFVDLGAGDGRSLAFFERASRRRGVGLELARSKVDSATRAGRLVFHGDLFDLPRDLRCGFVTLDNVLEHMPDMSAFEGALGIACRLATDAVVVRHPSFEDTDRLAAHNLALYWTDWTGHTCPATLADFLAIAVDHGAQGFEVHPALPITNSGHPSVLPLTAGRDQRRYDPALHGPKPDVDFDPAVPSAFDIVIHLSRPPRLRLVHPAQGSARTRPRIDLPPSPISTARYLAWRLGQVAPSIRRTVG